MSNNSNSSNPSCRYASETNGVQCGEPAAHVFLLSGRPVFDYCSKHALAVIEDLNLIQDEEMARGVSKLRYRLLRGACLPFVFPEKTSEEDFGK